ncbi:T6SS phospholipase effector Tle1-like catalytic domain-containing protein [Tenebrionibacter intestinalis]|jgi:hypothetical protein|uniref:DUF2235 domain-containing protein n=1 Tax=Tenebrionibacter intestinalis TaxID=2799638 RepID=A0A8K0UZX3_9ENTR|nr:DUF2235 domain-containing protein [Tenebrionibacter intestinalis]MBK4713992.1 DUF2235 domain-containing protein [Tenebrionibacter intestinalis]
MPSIIDSLKERFGNNQFTTTGEPCWVPPAFPERGRLPLTHKQVIANIKKIEREETQYRQQARREKGNPCCKSLHISLFFDGTNNNEPKDTASTPPHPSNVAKLYHACAPENRRANEYGFYAFYIPGVGTPFPQIGTYDYYSTGLQFAVGGEDRINWGLVQLCNALNHTVTKGFLGNGRMKLAIQEMNGQESTRRSEELRRLAETRYSGAYNREEVNQAYFASRNELNDLKRLRIRTMEQLLTPVREKFVRAQCKTVAIKLFVYGFSRGAAEARAFTSWLDEALAAGLLGFPAGTLLGVKVSVEFLGLFDTVPAVGVANVVPGFTGHNGWAGQTQPLPQAGLIKRCCHFVAAHEQRQAFSLDSIRTAAGGYLPHTREVVYPGMHSDVGGGYPPGDQGKSRGGAGELLSQITLHDMYAAAIDAGAPLTLAPQVFALLHRELRSIYAFREMDGDVADEFILSPQMVATFNNWRSMLRLDNQQEDPLADDAIYVPFRFESACLEEMVEAEMIWLTGWRIARFASPRTSAMNITSQPFFQHASQNPEITAQPYEAGFSQQAQRALAREWALQKCKTGALEALRKKEVAERLINHDPDWFPGSNLTGEPLFDANNARCQLWEAATEFAADYARKLRPEPLFKPVMNLKKRGAIDPATCTIAANVESGFSWYVSGLATVLQKLDPQLSRSAYIYTHQVESYEYLRFKSAGEYRFRQYIEPCLLKREQNDKIAGLINLYDNYVHDSRAWFMHSESGVREPFGSYFLSRMIYFGDKWNKAVQLRFDGQTMPGISEALQDKAVFAHVPTYGVKVFHRETGQEIAVDESSLPAPTHEFIAQIIPLVKQRRQERDIARREFIARELNRIWYS